MPSQEIHFLTLPDCEYKFVITESADVLTGTITITGKNTPATDRAFREFANPYWLARDKPGKKSRILVE